MTTLYAQSTPIDALEVGGESLVLLPPDRLVRLSPIGTAIFAAAASPCSAETIAALVGEQFGPPEDGDTVAAVRQFCADLVEAGVLGVVDG
ncbi:PqqD family protein [Tessaracoccus flavus]|uniref:Uncharacterized protein n=1 Tax=Tessaracoccus flavus TaxID=1610493 RepID=A0A1Q2CI87_9ACTN|nr:PqqD family protein [Tessaracoccus flavus]AQP45770.1 hypothetical protein RPIT_13960 [Tessaracoccus flavus]SDZ11619.1 Coenzyme PQQ synthesis protein D (PqqD) [Tessaracoccus flavus]